MGDLGLDRNHGSGISDSTPSLEMTTSDGIFPYGGRFGTLTKSMQGGTRSRLCMDTWTGKTAQK